MENLKLSFEIKEKGDKKILKLYNWEDGKYYDESELKKITEKALMKKRVDDKVSIVYKENQDFYGISFDNSQLQLSPLEGGSICARCRHCYALPDSEGGCERARVHTILYYRKNSSVSKGELVKVSDRIERFKFVKKGFETFNVKKNYEFLIVQKCKRFEADN